MQVQFKVTPEDYYQFQRYWWRRKSKIKPWMLVPIILAVTILPSIPVLIHQPLLAVLSIILPIMIVTLPWFLLFKPLTKWRAKSVLGVTALHTLEIDQDFLIEQTTVIESKVSWKQITSLEGDAKYTYFFLGPRNAVIFPQHSFPNPSEAHTFLSEAKDYWESARNGKPLAVDSGATLPPSPRPGA